jgi:hypothetical protein
MKVYASDVKDWSEEQKASGKRIEPSHPYDLEGKNDELFGKLLFFFDPVGLIWRFVVELFL